MYLRIEIKMFEAIEANEFVRAVKILEFVKSKCPNMKHQRVDLSFLHDMGRILSLRLLTELERTVKSLTRGEDVSPSEFMLYAVLERRLTCMFPQKDPHTTVVMNKLHYVAKNYDQIIQAFCLSECFQELITCE